MINNAKFIPQRKLPQKFQEFIPIWFIIPSNSPVTKQLLVEKYKEVFISHTVGYINMERIRVDDKGRIMIPNKVRDMMNIDEGAEITIIPRQDYMILCKPSSAREFKDAARKLSEHIAGQRRKISIEKLF